MDPLALNLNEKIKSSSPPVYDCLSELGKNMFFPAGILTQSAEAKEKANKFNATIGIATEKGEPMHLPVTRKYIGNLDPGDVYTYAPPGGRPKLRQLWKNKLFQQNPSLQGKDISLPIVTSALTNGLCIAGDLFVDQDDAMIIPDRLWGVYRLNFETRKGARIVTFPMFNDQQGFNTDGLRRTIEQEAAKRNKVLTLLSFPNNPTGYTPSVEETETIYDILKNQAETGTRIVVISDDAYFGLFYEDSVKESLFSGFSNLHKNILAVKLDGATKESYAWGFRTGFITFGTQTENSDELYEALDSKTRGIIRSTISSSNHLSQTILENILEDPEYYENLKEKNEILKGRALRIKEILKAEKFKQYWDYYPFNSGYFMCIRLHNIEAEKLRIHLLDKYGVGTIVPGKYDLRIAFSCVEEEDLEELFDIIYRAAQDLSS